MVNVVLMNEYIDHRKIVFACRNIAYVCAAANRKKREIIFVADLISSIDTKSKSC